MRKNTKKITCFFGLYIVLILVGCSDNKSSDKKNISQDKSISNEKKNHINQKTVKNGIFGTIESAEEFSTILNSEEDHIVLIDFYADWCMPCKILHPVLEEIAKEFSAKVSFYKLNIDKHRKIASKYRVRGIPYVVLFKNGVPQENLIGVQPKSKYVNAILRCMEK